MKNWERVIEELRFMERLKYYDPKVAGTFPIGIAVEGSDLDIICSATDFEDFLSACRRFFNSLRGYREKRSASHIVIRFFYDELPVEIYASATPTHLQAAYRHMLIEERILTIAGQSFREEIIRLKRMGYKTEPAFGFLLGLTDAYEALLELISFSDDDLQQLIAGAHPQRYV